LCYNSFTKKTKRKEKNVIQIQTTTENIESKGGLLLTGKIAMKARLGAIKSTVMKKAGTIITSLFGLMTEGKSDFESMGEKRGSLFFKEALGLDFVYAKETVRLYLEQMAVDADGIIEQLTESAGRIIKKAPLHGLWIKGKHYYPVDIDSTGMDNSKTKKEGVSRTYLGFEGYQPIFAYVGKEGYILDCELRPGSQHCQNGMPKFIGGLKGRLREVQPNGRYLFRLDSGNDAMETIDAIINAGDGFYCIIKRNKRRESDEKWLKRARRGGKLTEPRKGKKIWVGKTKINPHKEDMYCVYEVTERKTDSAGNQYLIPEIEVSSWWTNLDCEAEEVISLYRDHATSEQFHSELKSDLGIERLASGKLAVNKIMLAIAMNAYNALRLLGQSIVEREFWEKLPKRKRLGKVIRDMICVAGKLVKHSGTLTFKIYEKAPMLPIFKRLYVALDSP
jgi:hypothetical protein